MFTSSFKKIFFIGICLFFSSALSVHAATLSFSPAAGKYAVGDTIPVQIIVSSTDQSANAVSGTVVFPANRLTVTLLSKNNSIISFWAAEPSFSNTAGTINFEGVMLNSGFTGAKGIVLTAYFKVKTAGNAALTFSSGAVLANDGDGTDITKKPSGGASFDLVSAPPQAVPAVVEHTNNPASFSISEVKRDDPTNPVINLFFSSKSTALVDHYTVVIDNGVASNVVDPDYMTAPLSPGSHNVAVTAIYVGGDNLTSTVDVVVAPIALPKITHYTNNVQEGGDLTIQGTSLPGTTVSAFLKDQYGKIATQTTDVDNQGSFSIVWSSKLPIGVYKLTLQAVDARGAQSLTSDELSVLVGQTAITTWGLNIINYASIFVVFLILLSGLAFWGVYLWHKIKNFKKNLEEKITQVDTNLHKSFMVLFNDVKEYLDSIEKAGSNRSLTDEESRFIKKMSDDLKDAETFMDNRIKDLDK